MPVVFPCRDEITRRQQAALRALLRPVLRSNAFYRPRLEAAGLDPETATVEEFRVRCPMTSKRELVVDQGLHPPYGSNVTWPLAHYTRCHATSGSTGEPLRWLDTPESWEWMLRNWLEVYAACGVERSERVLFPFSFGPFLGFWTAFEAAVRLGCFVLPGGGLSSAARARAIVDHGITVVCCTPTYALHLAESARREGISLAASRPRRLILAGESGGSLESVRARIQAAWHSALVFDHYGMTEAGPVAVPCPASAGVLHVLETAYIAEVIDSASGAPAAPGAQGELVLTPLGRAGSPLLRYRTGDLVRPQAHPDGSQRCGCGRADVGLQGGIVGRADDMIIVRGVNVHPSAVEEILRRFPAVAEFQVTVDRRSSLPELWVAIECEPGIGDECAVCAAVETALRDAFALRVPVRSAPAGSLPRHELKARRWQTLTPDAAR
jgi:phenylacetate-CoA ligase